MIKCRHCIYIGLPKITYGCRLNQIRNKDIKTTEELCLVCDERNIIPEDLKDKLIPKAPVESSNEIIQKAKELISKELSTINGNSSLLQRNTNEVCKYKGEEKEIEKPCCGGKNTKLRVFTCTLDEKDKPMELCDFCTKFAKE
jgi:hypothetical protein